MIEMIDKQEPLRTHTACPQHKESAMNSTRPDTTTQNDDVQGHGINLNVNEAADSDDDVEGHGLHLNVNEAADSDDDVEGHGINVNVNEAADSDDDVRDQ
jgi:hypothetical protein